MKFAEVRFTLGDAEHTLRAECENKFLGSVLELSLDGASLALVQSVKKYSFYRIPLDGAELTVFVRISSRGVPSLELLVDGIALSTEESEDSFLAGAKAAAAKGGKLFALKNAALYFLLFTVAGLLFGVLRFGGDFSVKAVLVGLLCGAVVTAVFLIWDLMDLHFDLKNLQKSHASPTLLTPSDDETAEEDVDESVDPDSVEIPADAVSFFNREGPGPETDGAETLPLPPEQPDDASEDDDSPSGDESGEAPSSPAEEA